MTLLILFAVVFLVAAAVGLLLVQIPGMPGWAVTAAQVAAGVVVATLL